MNQQTLTIVFAVVVLGCLGVDLGLMSRKARVVTLRSALLWTAFWVTLALAFAGGIYQHLGQAQALTFLTGYVVEQSLSIDNLFVFLLIFKSFRTPPEHQHRVLFWGIIGALLLRAVCIGAGVVALQRFDWLTYVFGAILIWGGLKTAFESEDDDEIKDSRLVRLVRKVLPFTAAYEGNQFFVRQGGRTCATPLFLTLIVVEVSDLVFAVDSIPAVLAITQDPFLVYTTNVFAILGLRSIFFALAHMMRIFRYLKYALAVILVFVGVKIAAAHHYPISVSLTLSVIGAVLAAAALASVVIKPKAA